MAVTLTESVRNGIADYVTSRVNDGGGGYLEFLSTTGQIVARLQFSATAFQPAVNGIATTNPVTGDSFTYGGVISDFRVVSGNDVEIFSGSVSVISGGGDVELSALSISENDIVKISQLTFTAPS